MTLFAHLGAPTRLSVASRVLYCGMPVSRLLLTRSALAALGAGLIAACSANAQTSHPPPLPKAESAKSAASKPAAATKPAAANKATAPRDNAANSAPTGTPQAAKVPRSTNKANASSPLGTNLDAINDWSPDFAFVDAMKRSREWISSTPHSWEDERKFTLDAQGWPTSLGKGQLARTLIFWDQHHYPSGEYTVLYDGAGELDYDIKGKVVSKKPGRELVSIDSSGNFAVLIASLPKPKTYLKNLRVIMPGGSCSDDPIRYCDAKAPCAGAATCTPFEKTYEKQVFHPKFLERIAPFSVVRFMDWMNTNESHEVKWENRPKPSDARFRHGAPLETMVALANTLSTNPWFNIPHAADDEYVRKFATYVRDNLRPDLKAYVEYSNEVWNGMFPQAEYATTMGKKLGLGESNWDAQYRFYARRTTEVHKIWESVFKGQQKRVVRVLGTQVANAGVATAYLDFEDTKQHIDALAVAPYFAGEYGAPEEEKRWEASNVTAIIDDIRKRSLPAAFAMIKAHAEIAAQYKLELVAYEGGESFSGIAGTENNEKLNKLFDSVGRDPRMKQVYLEYLEGWKKNGGKLFVHFTDCYTPGKYGRWGALEYMEQPRKEAPKFDGLMTFIEKNKRWW